MDSGSREGLTPNGTGVSRIDSRRRHATDVFLMGRPLITSQQCTAAARLLIRSQEWSTIAMISLPNPPDTIDSCEHESDDMVV